MLSTDRIKYELLNHLPEQFLNEIVPEFEKPKKVEVKTKTAKDRGERRESYITTSTQDPMYNLHTHIDFIENNSDDMDVNKEFKKMYILLKKCMDH